MRRPVMDAARFGSIHDGDDSHRAVPWRDPLGRTWRQMGTGRERARNARKHPGPICGRQLTSPQGVSDHRQAKNH